MQTPEGYARTQTAAAHGLVSLTAQPWLESVFASGSTVHDWAREQPDTRTLRGRGTVYSVPAPVEGPDARERWAVRRYRRGGAVAAHLDDRYLYVVPTRPEIELSASIRARRVGIRTPAVVAGAWYRSGIFYRADLVTELVPDARTLADVLFGDADRDGKEHLLERAGSLARELGAKGVAHPDLNAMNVLVGPGGADDLYVLDLDRARVTEEVDERLGASMHRRLARSLNKLADRAGQPLSAAERGAFEAEGS